MPKKRRADEYENDEGSPGGTARNKKVKKDTSASKKKAKNVADGSEGKGKMNSKKKSSTEGGGKKNVPGHGERDSKGEEFWELSGKRRVTVSLFGGKHMINIREYYEKDGDFLPGKKGISLTMEQFNNLVSALPHIETVLAEKGETIPRPKYGAAAAKKPKAEKDEEESEAEDTGGEEDEEEEEQDKPTKKGKKNFEETSDED